MSLGCKTGHEDQQRKKLLSFSSIWWNIKLLKYCKLYNNVKIYKVKARWPRYASEQLESLTHICLSFSSVQFSHSVVSSSLRPHEPQHARPPCPSPTPRVHPNPCPLCWWYLKVSKSIFKKYLLNVFAFCIRVTRTHMARIWNMRNSWTEFGKNYKSCI